MNWEYKIIEITFDSSDWKHREIQNVRYVTIINKLGLEGWCLVSVDNGMAYFRRPVYPDTSMVKEETNNGY